MDQIATDPKVGMDDKKEMIEMLRRFEKQGEEEHGLDLNLAGHEDEDGEEDELEAKLRGIDLRKWGCTSCLLAGILWTHPADKVQRTSIPTSCSTCYLNNIEMRS